MQILMHEFAVLGFYFTRHPIEICKLSGDEYLNSKQLEEKIVKSQSQSQSQPHRKKMRKD